MNCKFFKLSRASFVVPLTAFCFVSTIQAQTAQPMAPSASMPMGHMQSGAAGHGDMKQSMTAAMQSMQQMQMSGDIDKDFAMMMKMHHQHGVEMAQIEVAHGKSPAMKAMAKKIITAQKKEIAQLEQWLSKQK